MERITLESLKDKYDVKCCVCGHEFYFTPSIMMFLGINSGHGSCSKCKNFLRLKINQETGEGSSLLFKENLK